MFVFYTPSNLRLKKRQITIKFSGKSQNTLVYRVNRTACEDEAYLESHRSGQCQRTRAAQGTQNSAKEVYRRR